MATKQCSSKVNQGDSGELMAMASQFMNLPKSQHKNRYNNETAKNPNS